jgi:hypothetical protein
MRSSVIVALAIAWVDVARADTRVDALESDARLAAGAHMCETVRHDLAELAALAPERAAALRDEPAVLACANEPPKPLPPPALPASPPPRSDCVFPVYGDASALFGASVGDYNGTTEPFIYRASLGFRTRFCEFGNVPFEMKLGVTAETDFEDYLAAGGEIIALWPVRGLRIGPRLAILKAPDSVALWGGVRVERGPLMFGMELFVRQSVGSHVGHDATGAYAFGGLTRLPGGILAAISAVGGIAFVAAFAGDGEI